MNLTEQEPTSNNVKISVIIPIYNVEKYLRQCLDSVIGQTLQELDIILVNDGSTDESGSICDEYSNRDPRVKVIHKKNAGVGMARNDGIEMATGEYITFVDSDDYLDNNMYELMYERANKENADFCSCGYRRVKNGNTLATYKSEEDALYESKEELEDVFLRFLGPLPDATNDRVVIGSSTCTALFTLDLIRRHNIRFRSEREVDSEDGLFKTLYLSLSSKICIISQALYNYRVTSNSLSQAYINTHMAKSEELYRQQLRILSENTTLYDEGKLRLQRNFLMHTRGCVKRCCANAASYAKARSELFSIISSTELNLVLKEYPWGKNPFKYRIFYHCMKHRWALILYQICQFSTYSTFRMPWFRR